MAFSWHRPILAAALALAALPSQADEFTVRIDGDDGVAYAGRYVLVDEDDGRITNQLTGAAPHVFSAEGACLALTLNKTSSDGKLRAKILRGPHVAAKGSASGAGGTVKLWAGSSGTKCGDQANRDWRHWQRKYGGGSGGWRGNSG
jgi:hypothetical protein